MAISAARSHCDPEETGPGFIVMGPEPPHFELHSSILAVHLLVACSVQSKHVWSMVMSELPAHWSTKLVLSAAASCPHSTNMLPARSQSFLEGPAHAERQMRTMGTIDNDSFIESRPSTSRTKCFARCWDRFLASRNFVHTCVDASMHSDPWVV